MRLTRGWMSLPWWINQSLALVLVQVLAQLQDEVSCSTRRLDEDKVMKMANPVSEVVKIVVEEDDGDVMMDVHAMAKRPKPD